MSSRTSISSITRTAGMEELGLYGLNGPGGKVDALAGDLAVTAS